jgi:hypothetical protein
MGVTCGCAALCCCCCCCCRYTRRRAAGGAVVQGAEEGKPPVVLFVVQEGEKNVVDQRLLEFGAHPCTRSRSTEPPWGRARGGVCGGGGDPG